MPFEIGYLRDSTFLNLHLENSLHRINVEMTEHSISAVTCNIFFSSNDIKPDLTDNNYVQYWNH